MKAGDKVVIINKFHAYAGADGVVSGVAEDEHGVMVFVVVGNKQEVMVEPSDVRVAR